MCVIKYINNYGIIKKKQHVHISYLVFIISQQKYIFVIRGHFNSMSSNTKFIKP